MLFHMSCVRDLQLYSFRSYHHIRHSNQNQNQNRFKVILRVYLSKIVTLKQIKLQSSNNTHQKECFNTFPTVIWFLHLHDSDGEIIQKHFTEFFFLPLLGRLCAFRQLMRIQADYAHLGKSCASRQIMRIQAAYAHLGNFGRKKRPNNTQGMKAETQRVGANQA